MIQKIELMIQVVAHCVHLVAERTGEKSIIQSVSASDISGGGDLNRVHMCQAVSDTYLTLATV